MSRLGIFIADGCEEVEALTVVDIVRRAKLEIDMISINGTKQVTSSRNVTFMTDTTKEEADFSAYDGIILPGGMKVSTFPFLLRNSSKVMLSAYSLMR